MTTKKSALRQYLDATKKETVLLGPIERHLLTLPVDTSRRQDGLHPSEVTKDDWCIRAAWFQVRGLKPSEPNPSLRLASIFAEGHSIHDKWQKWIGDADMLIGVWHCWEHGDWWGKRSDSCTFCEAVYKEVPVQHGELDIAGHADGWLTTGHLLEIKSIGTGTLRAGGHPISGDLSRDFASISRPFNNHIRQASLYIFCLRWMWENELLHQEPPDKLLFLYECKADQAAREFIVKYDEEYLAGFLEKRLLLDLDSEGPPICTGGPKCKQCEGLS